MLLNIASDIPFIFNGNNFTFFDRKKLETQLPKFFFENTIDTIYIINGPGNFSTTRIGVEVVNILIFLKKIRTVFYLNKIELFSQLGFKDIYLFSGNKNNKIHLISDNSFNFISNEIIDTKYSEEIFEDRNYLTKKTIKYEIILKNYANFNWNVVESTDLLKPYYVFDPAVNC